MKTIYYTATSLDGYIADSNHSLDWLFQFGEEPVGDYPGFIAGIGAIAMGSGTYEWLLRNHVYREGHEQQKWPYELPTWVFSTRSLRKVEDANIRFVSGDVALVHADMVRAADGKDIWIVGGGDLVGQFHDHGLLDELIVTIASVTLGSGAPLLPRRIATPPLELTSAQQYGPGFVELRYNVRKGGVPDGAQARE